MTFLPSTDHPLTPLGKMFEKALREHGLSQNRACKQAGIAVTNWNNVVYGGHERYGRWNPVQAKPVTIARLAFVLGLDIEKALKARGYTLADIPTPVDYDLSLVPAKQLQAELTRREKQPAEPEQAEREKSDDDFHAAVAAARKPTRKSATTRRPRS